MKEKIAIIGLGCVFPDAPDFTEYWKNIVEGKDSVRELSGEFWEAVQAMSFHKLNNMLMFVDINGYQCDGIMTSVMNIEPFDDRIRAFGGRVFRIDGHNIPLILETYQKACEEPTDKPTFILCDTDVCHHMDILRERSKFHYVRFSSQEEWQRYRDYYNERMQERSEGWKF